MEVPRQSGKPTDEFQLAWPAPPPQVDLNGPVVHVWSARLFRPDFNYEPMLALLPESERKRADKFHFERDRRIFIARRAFVRGVLALYLKIEPAGVELVAEDRGKPRLADPHKGAHLEFNFSHSRQLGLMAVGKGWPLGVDIEKVRPMPELDEMAANFCSPREKAAFDAAPADQRLENFFSIWTRKEAYLKGTGEGIALALAEIDCTQPPEPWAIYPLVPAVGFLAALAVKRGTPPPLCWSWPAA